MISLYTVKWIDADGEHVRHGIKSFMFSGEYFDWYYDKDYPIIGIREYISGNVRSITVTLEE